jgi:acid phosphatase family membrane protein YuiD
MKTKKRFVDFTLFYVTVSLILATILKLTPLGDYFSGHAMVLSSLVLIIAFLKGIKNPSFSLALVFSVLYLYDRVYIHEFIEFGHTFTEIIIGTIMGSLLTIILYALFEGFKKN